MALQEYRIKEFLGIDQSTGEGSIDPGSSPDACNMDTTDGGLGIAKGYVRHLEELVPGEKPIRRLFIWQSLVTTRYVVVAGNEVYAYVSTASEPAWQLVYSYPEEISSLRFDMAITQIDSVDHLLIACGEHPIIKWDGVSEAVEFGSEDALSNIKVNYLALHYGRLFSAGDPEHPSRLYWSQVPGDGRSIEDWSEDSASVNSGGGHVEVGDTAGDPITGLCVLSNQLLVFKKRSIYRLLGDRPTNFRVYNVNAEVEKMQNSACILYGDIPFWMTGGGLYYFDGQTALRSRKARNIRTFLKGADFSGCRAAKYQDRLYFTAYESARDVENAGASRFEDNALVVYDVERQTYMLRRGFNVADICFNEGALFMVNSSRRLYRLEEGPDYDGEPIEAYWQTPLTDLFHKQGIKCLQEMYLRGECEVGAYSAMLLDAQIGGNTHFYRYFLPDTEDDVLEIPLKSEGRTFSFCFYNEEGSRFKIYNGVQVAFEHRLRTV
ncbi:hypothetical protein LJC42_08825 [Eubacteriales bacterium OttesenSCG-928-K08]|nr:hypothetical protein [Eubacteriales bacterium OttesenSCG-928-K08]